MEIKMIVMPNAIECHAKSSLIAQMKYEETCRQRQKERQDAKDDLPRIVEYINKRIEDAVNAGANCVCFSISDDTYITNDPRIEFHTHGYFGADSAKFLNELYESLGFTSECRTIGNRWHNGGSSYRAGEIFIAWKNLLTNN